MPRLTRRIAALRSLGAGTSPGGGGRDRRLADPVGPLPQRHDVPSPRRGRDGVRCPVHAGVEAPLAVRDDPRRRPRGPAVLIGYAAVNPHLGMDGVLLFLILVLWQPPHFWPWRCATRRSTARRASGSPRGVRRAVHQGADLPVRGGAAPLSLSLWALGYLSARFGWAAFLLGAGFLAVFYRETVATRRFGRAFAASIVYLTLLLLALLADVLFR